MVVLNLSKEDCKNAADMIEMYFFGIKPIEPYNIEDIRSTIKFFKFCDELRSAIEYKQTKESSVLDF